MVSGAHVPPLSRPQLAEARRVRAVELFGQGLSNPDVALMVGVHAESALEQGAQTHGFEADRWTLERVGVVVERYESEIARWVAHEWPRIKGGR
ncbi:hypothetical protein ACGH7X_05085 [Streptomyces sp. BBFR51]|uniref:hypothetical protein n=1 Tax=Streptomyces sp. BBFR51 TaxID=3372856 RepID=UPI0037DD103A